MDPQTPLTGENTIDQVGQVFFKIYFYKVFTTAGLVNTLLPVSL